MVEPKSTLRIRKFATKGSPNYLVNNFTHGGEYFAYATNLDKIYCQVFRISSE